MDVLRRLLSSSRGKAKVKNAIGLKIRYYQKVRLRKLQEGGEDIHDLKGGKSASKYDLYKDRKGNIYVKRKGGQDAGESTNINNYK